MRRLAFYVVAACVLAAGCAGNKPRVAQSVTAMPPGYGVIVATFRYTAGESSFPQEQIFSDARYLEGRLASRGRQAFIVYGGGNWTSVGFRAATHDEAERAKAAIEAAGTIDLGDGSTLKVPKVEIVNIAELKAYALDLIP